MTQNKQLEKKKSSQLQLVRDACAAALQENPILTTSELKEHCRKSNAFLPSLYESAADAKETSIIDQALSTLKDGNGNRSVHSVTILNAATGKTEKHHYQESLFDLTHYTVLIPKVATEARAKTKKAKALNDNCKRKFDADISQELPFDFDAVCDAFSLNESAAKK